MFCRKCGKEIPDGSAFCGECGTKAGESGAPQIAYAVREARPKPILTSGENAMIRVIGVLQIILPAILMSVLLIGGWSAGIGTGSMDGFLFTGMVILPFTLVIGAILFSSIMIFFKRRWALVVASVGQYLSVFILSVSLFSGNVSALLDLILCVVMLILIHKCQNALSREVQESRRNRQRAGEDPGGTA